METIILKSISNTQNSWLCESCAECESTVSLCVAWFELLAKCAVSSDWLVIKGAEYYGATLSLLICDHVIVKSNLHYTRRITPKRVTSCGSHLRGLAPGQHSSEETSQRWRVVGDTVSFDLPGSRTPDLPHR